MTAKPPDGPEAGSGSVSKNLAYTAVAGLGAGGVLAVLGYTVRYAQSSLLGGVDFSEYSEKADLAGASAAFLSSLPTSLLRSGPLWLAGSLLGILLLLLLPRFFPRRPLARPAFAVALALLLTFLFYYYAVPLMSVRDVLIRNAPELRAGGRSLEYWSYLACPVWKDAPGTDRGCAKPLHCSEVLAQERGLADVHSDYVGASLLVVVLFAGVYLSPARRLRKPTDQWIAAILGVGVALELWFLAYSYGKTKASIRPPRIEAVLSEGAWSLAANGLPAAASSSPPPSASPATAIAPQPTASDGPSARRITGWIVGRRGDRSVIYDKASGSLLELSSEDLGPVKLSEPGETILDSHIRSNFACSSGGPL